MSLKRYFAPILITSIYVIAVSFGLAATGDFDSFAASAVFAVPVILSVWLGDGR